MDDLNILLKTIEFCC